MKKVFALVLALAMIFAMAVPAMAAGSVATNLHEHTITIDAKPGYEYEAYQIFYGDLDEKGTLSNIVWGNAVKDKAMDLLAALKAADEAYKDCNEAEDVAAVLGKNSSADNDQAKAFADIVATKNNPASGTDVYAFLDESQAHKEDAENIITVEGDGYYLIVNSKVPVGEDVTYSRHMLEVVRDVTVTHKGTFPTVDKKILDNGEKVDINEAAIGEPIQYEIVGNLPNNLNDYDTYYYAFHDTLSKGLSLKDTDPFAEGIQSDIKVTVNGVDVTNYFHISHTAYSETAGTQITVGIQDILALELLTDPVVGDIKGGMLATDTKVVVTYTAYLNENAVVAVAGNPNVVNLEYSNDPNTDGDGATTPPHPKPELPEPSVPTGETPEKKVESYTTKLSIQKTDGTGKALKGAEFHLTGSNLHVAITTGNYFVPNTEGAYYKLLNNTYTTVEPVPDNPETTDVNEDNTAAYVQPYEKYELVTKVTLDTQGAEAKDLKAFVDENGQLTFTGLGAGEYILTETVTPAGFNTIDPIKFTVTFNVEKKMFRSDNPQINVGQDSSNENHFNSLYTTVVNHAGSTLPSTGGIGTTLFYVFGGLMFVGAAVLLVTKKRMAC